MSRETSPLAEPVASESAPQTAPAGESWRAISFRGRIATGGWFVLLAAILFAITPAHNVYDGPLRLARELISGRSYLPEFLPWIEMFRHDGRDYLAYPPMVSFVLVPYVWLTQGKLGQPPFNSLLIFGSAILVHRLVRALPGISRFAPVAAFAYAVGTPLLYSAHDGNVWLLMHSEGSFFLLLAMVLAIAARRTFWAGLSFMVAVQTRYVIALAGLVFALLFLQRALAERRVSAFFRSSALFAAGALPPLFAALAFQWWTLGDPLLSPYAAGWKQWALRGPLFSLDYIWRNLPVYTFAHPELVPHFPFLRFDASGQAIWIMSPFFLGVFALNWRLPFVRAFLPSALAMMAFYLVYFGTGFAQYGARYMQDLYPVLLPLALSGFSRPGRGWRMLFHVLVGISIVINVYGVYVMALCPW